MFEYFILLKSKPTIKPEFVDKISEGEYRLNDGNVCLLHEEINSSYVLDFYGDNPPENPTEYLTEAGFITGKYIYL